MTPWIIAAVIILVALKFKDQIRGAVLPTPQKPLGGVVATAPNSPTGESKPEAAPVTVADLAGALDQAVKAEAASRALAKQTEALVAAHSEKAQTVLSVPK